MADFWFGVLVNLVSDAIFLTLIIAASWLLFVVFRRNPLLKFFGVKESRSIVIYLSDLNIVRGGALGIDRLRRSYQGSAVVFREAQVANQFRELFNYAFPGLSDQPGLLSKLLLADVMVHILPSPKDIRELESTSSILSLGSPGYNRVSQFIEERLGSNGQFRHDYGSIHVGRSNPITGAEYGFVERIYDENANRNVFYVAGLSETGTVGAAYYLLKQYRQLYKNFGTTTNFVQLLRFDADDYRRYEIVPIGMFRQQTSSGTPSGFSGISPHINTTAAITNFGIFDNVVHWKDPRPADVILAEMLNKPTSSELGSTFGLGTARFVPPSGAKSEIPKDNDS